MEKTKFFLCLLLSLYSISSTQINLAAFPEEDGIMVLTDETFEEAENTYDFLFVHFFAPWCGICEMSLKDLAKELPEIKKEVSNVGFAKIDGTYYRKFYNKYDANGFPTVFLVAKGQKISEYNGAKKANLIIEWLNERILPTVVPIDSVEMFNKYVKKSENKPLLAYFGYNFDEFTSFDKLANNYLKDFTFINIRDKVAIVNKSLYPRFNISKAFGSGKAICHQPKGILIGTESLGRAEEAISYLLNEIRLLVSLHHNFFLFSIKLYMKSLDNISSFKDATSLLLEYIRDAFDETSHLFVFWVYLYLHFFTVLLYFCLGWLGTPGNSISKLLSSSILGIILFLKYVLFLRSSSANSSTLTQSEQKEHILSLSSE